MCKLGSVDFASGVCFEASLGGWPILAEGPHIVGKGLSTESPFLRRSEGSQITNQDAPLITSGGSLKQRTSLKIFENNFCLIATVRNKMGAEVQRTVEKGAKGFQVCSRHWFTNILRILSQS